MLLLYCDMFVKTYRWLFFVLFLFFLSSCTFDEQTNSGPGITFKTGNNVINTDTVISPGQAMNFGIIAEGDEFNLTQFYIKVISDTSQEYFDTGFNAPYLSWMGTFTKSFHPFETWEFTVRDRYSNIASVYLVISADTNILIGGIDIFQDITLGAQINNQVGCCFSLVENKNYFLEEGAQNEDKIDLLYYFFGEDENVISSPGANIESGVFPEEHTPTAWSIRNTTRFIKTGLDTEIFDQIQNDSLLIASYIEGEGKRKAKNLLPGDIYSFKTQDQRFGIFKIEQVEGMETGTVVFDIKIQKNKK